MSSLPIVFGVTAFFWMFFLVPFGWFRFRLKRRPMRAPFTQDFRNGPGRSLGEKLDANSEKQGEILVQLVIIPVVLGFMIALMPDESRLGNGIVLCVLLAPVYGWFVYRAYRQMLDLRKLRLGMQGEIYVAQCLTPLIKKRYRIFHDYPAKGFNIDHIAIGPDGVFAIETKARSKPDRKGGRADATVKVDGERLIFPDYVDDKSVPQAKRQALWLQDQLKRQFGKSTPVVPVLVIPGWRTDIVNSPGLMLSAGKGIDETLPQWGREPLERDLFPRYVDHFIQKCSYDPAARN